MNFFSLDEHSQRCEWPSKRHFMFQYRYDFYCVIYCQCFESFDHLDWKKELLKSVAKKVGKPEKFDRWGKSNINKSIDLKKCIMDNNVSDLLSSKMTEVCSTYSDNAGKEYCFGAEHTYTDFLVMSSTYIENIRKAITDIRGKDVFDYNDKKRLEENIWELRKYNEESRINKLSHIQKIKLTKLLSKNFIKNYANDY